MVPILREEDPTLFCKKCGTRLPDEPEEDEGRHCQGMLPSGKKCAYIEYPENSPAVVTVIQPVIREDGSIGLLEVQRKRRDGSIRPPEEGWCHGSGHTRRGKTLEQDGENEVLGESGNRISLRDSIVVDAETATAGETLVAILATPIHERDLRKLPPNQETSAVRIGTPDQPLIFSIHQRWKDEFFAGRFNNWPKRIRPVQYAPDQS